MTTKRPVLAIIGTGRASTDGQRAAAYTLGKLAVDHGFRIVTGGLDGVMEAACQGAHSSDNYREGATIGILPDSHDGAANRWVDITIPTGMGLARNVLVIQSADVVVAVGGGSGTLSEIAFAWQLGRPLIALSASGGWSARLANQRLDHRSERPIQKVSTASEAIEYARDLIKSTSKNS